MAVNLEMCAGDARFERRATGTRSDMAGGGGKVRRERNQLLPLHGPGRRWLVVSRTCGLNKRGGLELGAQSAFSIVIAGAGAPLIGRHSAFAHYYVHHQRSHPFGL